MFVAPVSFVGACSLGSVVPRATHFDMRVSAFLPLYAAAAATRFDLMCAVHAGVGQRHGGAYHGGCKQRDKRQVRDDAWCRGAHVPRHESVRHAPSTVYAHAHASPAHSRHQKEP